MRVAIFTDAYTPQINGVVTSVEFLTKSLRELGHKVIIITPSDPECGQIYGVIHIPSIKFVLAPQFRMGFIYSYKTVKALKKLKVDVIHCHTEFCMGIFSKLMGLSLDLPSVYTYHTLYEFYTHYVTKKYFKRQARDFVIFLSKIFAQSCNALIVPSAKAKKILEGYGITKPISVVPTGLDLSSFQRDRYTDEDRLSLRRKYGYSADDFLCLYLGRVSEEKSIDLIIKTFKNVVEAKMKLLVVGDGPELEKLKILSNALDLNHKVTFAGAVPYSEVPLYYQISDVFINASVTETQGLTFVEAMASGCVIMARDEENVREMVADNNAGILYADQDDLLEKLIYVASHSDDTELMKINARNASRRYSYRQYGISAAEIYADTAAKYKKARKHHWLITKISMKSMKSLWTVVRRRWSMIYKVFSNS